MKYTLQKLTTDTDTGRASVPTFCEITNDSYLLSSNYSNPISRNTQATAKANASNVIDFKTGKPVSLGDFENTNPSLYGDLQNTLSLGQEPVASAEFNL